MIPLISAEWYKLLHSKLLAIILAGIAVVTLIQIVSSYFMKETPILGQYGVTAPGDNASMLCVWIAAFVGLFIASEFQHGTIRNVLALGKNRTHVFLSRVLSASIAVAVILAIVSLVATAGYSVAFGFGNMALGEFLRFFSWNFFMQLLWFLPYAAIFSMFAFLCKSPGMTVLLCIGYEIAVLSIGGFLNNYPGESLKFGLEFFPEYYISEFEKISDNPALITKGVIVGAVYIVLPCIIGCAVFKKSDIR